MTAASDLDLILLYDFDEPRPESDGARPLHALQYYTRLTQRLISALTVATRRGQLYEVDMRLRPSGRKGPVATQFRAFVDYQRNAAETWEHMALTRARVIGGDGPLMAMATQAIGDILRLERNPEKLRRDAFEMRALIAQEKGDDDPWDLKLAAGGIIDVEFIAQVLTLRHGARHPDLIDTDMAATLAHAVRLDLIGRDEGEGLIAAYRLYAAVMQMIRLTSIGAFDPATAAAGVKRRIAAAAEMPDFAHLERTIIETRAEVREIFLAVLGSPLPLGEG
jgi:glutamate-ammonia-ligase adenylyltransferase